MQMLEITEEQGKFIKELAEKMKSQDNRATRLPLFVIQVDKKAYGDSSWCNEAERKEDRDGELCEKCTKLEEESDELPEYCRDCDSDCFVWFNWEEEFDLNAGVFLTAEACDEHIRLNHYHYTNPRSYAVSAWRNPEMETLMTLLFSLAGIELPMAYK